MSVDLTGKQAQAISALLSEPTLEKAATKAKVGDRTLRRWLREPFFAAAYRDARRNAVGQAIARLQQVSSDAVDALHSVMTDSAMPGPARVAAARTVLELSIKGVEIEDLQERIETLERAFSGSPQ